MRKLWTRLHTPSHLPMPNSLLDMCDCKHSVGQHPRHQGLHGGSKDMSLTAPVPKLVKPAKDIARSEALCLASARGLEAPCS
eukprot:1033863-Amphidinium_carterae.1